MVLPIRVDEPSGERFDLALEQFASGKHFVFRGSGLCLRNSFVEVRVPCSWEVQNTNEQRAREDLERAERNIRRLREVSPRFSRIVAALPIRFILVFDYGTGGIELCELQGDILCWRPGYPRHAPAS